MMKCLVPILLSVAFASACASRPAVTLVSNDTSADMKVKEIDGVPFRVKQRQIVRLFQWNASTQKYEEVFSQPVVLADMSRLYSLDVKSQAFASPSLQITEASDNTISTTEIAGTDNSSAAIDAVTGGIAGYTTAKSTALTAQSTQTTAEVTAFTNCQKAIQAQEALASTATSADVALAKVNVELARQQLLQAYAVAGSPPPAICLSS